MIILLTSNTIFCFDGKNKIALIMHIWARMHFMVVRLLDVLIISAIIAEYHLKITLVFNNNFHQYEELEMTLFEALLRLSS